MECARQLRAQLYARDPATEVERVRQWRLNNSERYKRAEAIRWGKNREALNAAARARYYEAKAAGKQRAKASPEAVKASSLNRRARKRRAPGRHTRDDIARLLFEQRGRCAYCGCALGTYHVDHIVPLSRGGDNWPTNLCLACPSCNISKGRRTAEEFKKWRAHCATANGR